MITLCSKISTKQFGWRNNPKINMWTRQNGVISKADMKNWRTKIENDPTIKMFGIANKTTEGVLYDRHEIVGTAGLTSISHVHGSAEFSLLIGPEHQGKGFGKAALIELLRYGFQHLRLNLIWGETIECNPAREMFKKIGFVEEGLLRNRYFKFGKYKNSIMLSITKEEFDARYST